MVGSNGHIVEWRARISHVSIKDDKPAPYLLLEEIMSKARRVRQLERQAAALEKTRPVTAKMLRDQAAKLKVQVAREQKEKSKE